MKRFCAPFTRLSASPCATVNCYWNLSEGLVDRKLSHEIKAPAFRRSVGRGASPNHRAALQRASKSKDRSGPCFTRRPGRRVTPSPIWSIARPAKCCSKPISLLRRRSGRHLPDAGITGVDVFFPDRDDTGVVISRTLDKDSIRSSREALIEIYRKLRPGDPPTLETATALFNGMFFDPRKYDFSKVGRLKFNIKLGLETPLETRTLDSTDFVAAIRYLLKLRKNIGRSTTSIIWAIAASVRSASSWKISSASGSFAWSAPSRKRCPFTRKCPRPCRMTW